MTMHARLRPVSIAAATCASTRTVYRVLKLARDTGDVVRTRREPGRYRIANGLDVAVSIPVVLPFLR